MEFTGKLNPSEKRGTRSTKALTEVLNREVLRGILKTDNTSKTVRALDPVKLDHLLSKVDPREVLDDAVFCEGCQRLANAVIEQACHEYLTAKEDKELCEIVDFFYSECFARLTDLEPDPLLQLLQQKRAQQLAQKEAKKKPKKKAKKTT